MTKSALSIVIASLPLLACTGAIDGGAPGQPNLTGGSITGSASGAAGNVVVTGAGGDASGSGTGVAGAAVNTGAAGDPATGAAGAGAAGTGAAGTGVVTGAAGAGAPACGPGAIPADVAAVISSRCVACHGSPPIAGVPSSLTTYASLTAPSKTDPTKSVAAVALARMQGGAMPMPPAPFPPATASEIAAFQSWVSAGTPAATCPGGADGGAPIDAGGGIVDPYSTPVVCTSKTMWTQGTRGSGAMEPGQACIACHSKGEGPRFSIGGTVYPTAHEPDNCNGGNLTSMAQVIVTGKDGNSVTMTPNSAGNFYSNAAIVTPYTVKVTYMGRTRVMIAAQTSGDCNTCHTEMGAMMAPGRIMLP
jgi:hypothetical protein